MPVFDERISNYRKGLSDPMALKTLLVSFIGAVLAFGCFPHPLNYRLPEAWAASSRAPRIIAFGDSLTAGTGARTGMDYPSQLSRIIGVQVTNKGVPGDTTVSARARLAGDVLSRSPDIVLITLGGNDMLMGVPVEKAMSNLKAIVGAIQARGATVIIGGIALPQLDQGYGEGYSRVATDTGAILIPNLFERLFLDWSLMSDPIHPNSDGYSIFARMFEDAMKPCLKSLRSRSSGS